MKLPQLHLRDLFWLVLVVAMGLGWAYDRLGAYIIAQHATVGFEAANEILEEQTRAAAAEGYRFDYRDGKYKMIPVDESVR